MIIIIIIIKGGMDTGGDFDNVLKGRLSYY